MIEIEIILLLETSVLASEAKLPHREELTPRPRETHAEILAIYFDVKATPSVPESAKKDAIHHATIAFCNATKHAEGILYAEADHPLQIDTADNDNNLYVVMLYKPSQWYNVSAN